METQIGKKPRAARTEKFTMLRRYKIDHKAMYLEKKVKISDYNITLTLSHNTKIVNNIWCRRILVKMLLGGDDP